MSSSTVTSSTYPSLEHSECPFPFLAQLQRDEPVFQVPSRPDHFVVTRHDDVMEVLQDTSRFSNASPTHSGSITAAAGAAVNLLGTDPPVHTRERKMIIRPFTPGRLKSYEASIQRIVDALIDDFIADGRLEFVRQFAGPLPIHVTCELMGLPREDYEWFRVWGQLEGRGTMYLPEERQQPHRDNAVKMGQYLARVLQERYSDPQDDAISELIQMQVDRDGEFDLPLMTVEAGVLVAGGVVTTAHMMGSAMVLLLQHPEQMRAVRDDHRRIPRMLEESLRVESPVQWQPRRATVDTEIGGVTIPAGSTIIVGFQAANRDEDVFTCPAGFDIERPNVKSHVSFGYGAHFCLGAPLARLEGRIAFETLFRRLENIRFAADAGELAHITSVSFRGPRTVELEFDPVTGA